MTMDDTRATTSDGNAAGAGDQERAPEGEPTISIDDFLKVKLRVGRVLEAERVEGADRLLRLQISLGDERRQLVAGVAERYQPEELVGRKIIVVANLKPARIRGVQSEGMLLAAEDTDGSPVLATFAEPVEPGSRVR